MKRDVPDDSEFARNLPDKLEIFYERYRSYQGREETGSREFLNQLLSIYEVSHAPGTIFEQHPIRVRSTSTKARQGSLFATETVEYTAEKMDMYLPRVCVWEMKAPAERDLQKHHAQILGYWARVQTRYMVLCNFQEFWIYDTNDEGGQNEPKLKFSLKELSARGDALLFLRGEQPDLNRRAEEVTREVAKQLGSLVRDLVQKSAGEKDDRERIAKFVLECMFAMFAEDTELLPAGMFTNAIREAQRVETMQPIWNLFDDLGQKNISNRSNRLTPYVNGPLFDREHPKIKLAPEHIKALYDAAKGFDWGAVRPEIFGSIFEQALNPVERHELGAHFTREDDIMKVVGPTVIEPWRARIKAIRSPKDAQRVVDEMRGFHVLDPACGCGNFLYVVYREMKRLEAALSRRWTEIHHFVAKRRADIPPPPQGPWFTLEQVHGIELNQFAAFLARVVLWVGEHLANRELGLADESLPLKNLDRTVVQGDALELAWPRPDGELAIVGNPPYLGVRKLRKEYGDAYVESLFQRFPDNRAADYVTYWFTRSLDVLRKGERAGFVCTNSVAQNESREASIDRVAARGGTLTDAWRSFPWQGDAAVHVTIVNWIMESYEGLRRLDGAEVDAISLSITDSTDVTTARTIPANEGLCFMGVTPGNAEFVLTDEQRAEILEEDSASEAVIRPFLIGRDVNREVDQGPTRWIIDFGAMTKADAQQFKDAFKHVQRHVYPVRKANPREKDFKNWWQFWQAGPNLRAAIDGLEHVLVISSVGPHLLVSRQPNEACFDHQLFVVALGQRYHLGVLQSHIHEVWARARGSSLKGDLRYTGSTIFST